MHATRSTLLGLTLLLAGHAGAVTLVYGSGGDPVSLESGNINDTNSAIVQNQIYDTLTKVRPGTTTLAPGLASSCIRVSLSLETKSVEIDGFVNALELCFELHLEKKIQTI